MPSNKIVFYSVLLLTVLFLTRCGSENVCVGGLGNCATNPVTQTQTGTEELKLTVDYDVIKLGKRATFKASGGTKPYTFKIYQGNGTLVGNTITEDSQEYEAPNFETSAAIRVYDAKNNYKTRTITIEQ